VPMGQRILLPDAEEVVLELLRNLDRNSLCMVLRSAGMRGVCPRCQSGSYRVHSRYLRTLADLPWEGIPVRIELRVRRFFCDAVDCEQRIFTERLPGTVAKYGRRTCRLGETLDRIVMALGGAAGSRLAEQLWIFASGSTLLRQLRRTKADMADNPERCAVGRTSSPKPAVVDWIGAELLRLFRICRRGRRPG
jgi:transposase